jgi:hypothetical protein
MADTSHKCTFIDRTEKPVGEYEVEYVQQGTLQVSGARPVLPGCVALPDGRVFYRKNDNSDQYVEKARPCTLLFAELVESDKVGLDGRHIMTNKRESVEVFQPSPGVVTKGGKTFKRLNEDLYKEVVVAAL